MHCATLQPHPSSAPAPLRSIEARVGRGAEATLALCYLARGDIGRLRVPQRAPAARRDGLWRRTCFEAFLGGAGTAYCELNFAPSGAWAAYRFDDYRSGRVELPMGAAPAIEVRCETDALALDVQVALAELPPARAGGTLHLALAAVIEDEQGRLSYWALRHPSGRPDFHHREGFALELA